MIVGCVVKIFKDLNQLPAENGISDTASPSTLITGRARPYYVQVNKSKFGGYVQAYINKRKTNTNKVRTVGTIALHLSGNEQEGVGFYVISYGKTDTLLHIERVTS